MKTSSLLLAVATITVSTLFSAIGHPSGAQVIFKVNSFESAPDSKKTWTKIVTKIQAQSLSSLSVVPDTKNMIVKDIDGQQDAKILIFIPEKIEGDTYAWPFTITYTDKSGQTIRESYRAEYRKGSSPGFTIVFVES